MGSRYELSIHMPQLCSLNVLIYGDFQPVLLQDSIHQCQRFVEITFAVLIVNKIGRIHDFFNSRDNLGRRECSLCRSSVVDVYERISRPRISGFASMNVIEAKTREK